MNDQALTAGTEVVVDVAPRCDDVGEWGEGYIGWTWEGSLAARLIGAVLELLVVDVARVAKHDNGGD